MGRKQWDGLLLPSSASKCHIGKRYHQSTEMIGSSSCPMPVRPWYDQSVNVPCGCRSQIQQMHPAYETSVCPCWCWCRYSDPGNRGSGNNRRQVDGSGGLCLVPAHQLLIPFQLQISMLVRNSACLTWLSKQIDPAQFCWPTKRITRNLHGYMNTDAAGCLDAFLQNYATPS